QRQVAVNVERTRCTVSRSRAKRRATRHADIATKGARTAQCRAAGYCGVACRRRLVTIDQQRASLHCSRPGITIVTRQGGCSSADLVQTASARNQASKRIGVGAVKGERVIVEHIAIK